MVVFSCKDRKLNHNSRTGMKCVRSVSRALINVEQSEKKNSSEQQVNKREAKHLKTLCCVWDGELIHQLP